MKAGRNFFRLFIFGLLLLWLILSLARPLNLTAADLGRHLKNSEFFLANFFQVGFKNEVLSENFYSYTESKFPFLNHHWGSGIIFFIVFQLIGFKGVSLFFIFLSLLTFSLFFWIAVKKSNFLVAVLFSLLLIPLIGSRTEIRPEIFSYLFSAILVTLLFLFCEEKISWRILVPALFCLQMLWVNLHVYFVFGPIILTSFLLEEIIKKQAKNRIKILAFCLLLTLLAFLLNPHGLKIFKVFFIFENYGYLVVENQSIGFLEKLGITNPNFSLFKIVAFLLLISSIFVLLKKRTLTPVSLYLPSFILTVMGYLAIRNFSLFALFALLTLSFNVSILIPKRWAEEKWLFTTVAVIIFLFNFFRQVNDFPLHSLGFGLLPKVNGSAEFFKENNLCGPIFNNYDIGGYLIFHLFPKEKIFVDNRPEAYSTAFFQDIYIPLQQDEEFWRKKSEEYQFNAIFFYRHDATPWAQPFLIERLKDPKWAPVFVDDYAIIFLKRNEINQSTIKKYEIPREYFRIIKTR